MQVTLQCGSEDSVVSVLEPNRCEYAMTCAVHARATIHCVLTPSLTHPYRIYTPLACSKPEHSRDEL